MDALTDEQTMLMSSLREMAEREFAEAAFTWQGETPWDNVALLADRGYLGLNIDEAYGGGGLDEIEAVLSVEVVGEVCPDTAQHLYTQQLVGPRANTTLTANSRDRTTYPAPSTGQRGMSDRGSGRRDHAFPLSMVTSRATVDLHEIEQRGRPLFPAGRAVGGPGALVGHVRHSTTAYKSVRRVT